MKHPNISLILTAFPPLVLACLTLSVQADTAQKWVNVEIIIFETKDQQALKEAWPLNPKRPILTNALSPQNAPTTHLVPIAEQKLQLNNAKKKIQQRYRLVMHQGWRQPLTDKAHAQNIHLSGGKQFAANTYEVNGTIKVNGGQYLHASADLLLQKPMQVITSDQSIGYFSDVADLNHWQHTNVRLQGFALKENVRLRYGEIQYLDHPLYGVILLITPVK